MKGFLITLVILETLTILIMWLVIKYQKSCLNDEAERLRRARKYMKQNGRKQKGVLIVPMPKKGFSSVNQ